MIPNEIRQLLLRQSELLQNIASTDNVELAGFRLDMVIVDLNRCLDLLADNVVSNAAKCLPNSSPDQIDDYIFQKILRTGG